MGMGIRAGPGEENRMGIEPGSSYLAVLSMTGGVGTAVFLSALGFLLFRFAFSRRPADLDREILSVVGIYLGVHGVAEGWIFGFGHPLCFLFWLWLGNVGDAALQPIRATAKHPLLRLQTFRPPRPALRSLA